MSFSLTPAPNQAPTNWPMRVLFCSLLFSGVLSGCGLKDDLILPNAKESETSLTASMAPQDTMAEAETQKVVE